MQHIRSLVLCNNNSFEFHMKKHIATITFENTINHNSTISQECF